MNWEIVVSILAALGLFEAVKLLLHFWLKETLIARNLEIRKIANNALEALVWLKERNFETPLPRQVERELVLGIHKIDSYDKDLGDKLMKIVNSPRFIEILYKSGGEKNRKLITEIHKDVYKTGDYLSKKLSKLRYKSIFGS